MPVDCEKSFNPSEYTEDSYVNRDEYTRELSNALNYEKWRVMVVIGLSRVGKTVLVTRVLETKTARKVWVRGGNVDTESDLWKKIGRELGMREREVSWSAEGGFSGLGLGLGGNKEVKWVEKIDLDSVTAELRTASTILVIDDFHYIPRSLREILAKRRFKSLTEDVADLKIVVIYVPTRQIVLDNPWFEFQDRLKLIHLPLWSVADLTKIARARFAIENLAIRKGLEDFSSASFGLPSIMQRFCLAYCQHVKGHINGPEIVDIDPATINHTFEEVSTGLWELGNNRVHERLTESSAAKYPHIFKLKASGQQGNINKIILAALITWRTGIGSDDKQVTVKLEDLLNRLHDDVEMSSVPMTIKYKRKVVTVKDDSSRFSKAFISDCLIHMASKAEEEYISKLQIVKGEAGIEPPDPILDYNEADKELLIYSPSFLVSLRSARHQARLRE